MVTSTWMLLDHGFWQTLATTLALLAAGYIGFKQNQINKNILGTQDEVEVYASFAVDQFTENGEVKLSNPKIHIQNVGTRLIYIDSYIFNKESHDAKGQVLASTYSQALNNYYWITLPVNGESEVLVKVNYRDSNNRRWVTKIEGKKEGNAWRITTYPKEKVVNR